MTSLSAAPGAANVGWMAFCQAIAVAKDTKSAQAISNPTQKGTIRDANPGR